MFDVTLIPGYIDFIELNIVDHGIANESMKTIETRWKNKIKD